jgi:chromosome partitioning protein
MFHVEQSVADCQCPSLAEMFHVEHSARSPSLEPVTVLEPDSNGRNFSAQNRKFSTADAFLSSKNRPSPSFSEAFLPQTVNRPFENPRQSAFHNSSLFPTLQVPAQTQPLALVLNAMGKVVGLVNQKGGVGKTTTAINLSACLALDGLKILLADCDPQANASSGLGFQRDDNRHSVYDVVAGESAADQVILPTAIQTLWLLPGSKNLTGANIELANAEDRTLRLRRALDPIRDRYDLIFLDCPPALDLLTLNVLCAAETLIVPMQAEYFALEGVSELISTLERVREAYNPNLTIEGVLLTMYDDRTNLAQQVTETLREYFRELLYQTVIPRNVRLAEAPSHGKPVALYDARSRGTDAYFELADEFLARNHIESPRGAERRNADRTRSRSKGPFWPYN